LLDLRTVDEFESGETLDGDDSSGRGPDDQHSPDMLGEELSQAISEESMAEKSLSQIAEIGEEIAVGAPVGAGLLAPTSQSLRKQLLEEFFLDVAGLLGKEKISFVALKGLPLSNTYYEEIPGVGGPARVFGDLDILLRRRDVKRACRLFKSEGFLSSSDTLSPSQFRWELKTQHAFEFKSPSTGSCNMECATLGI